MNFVGRVGAFVAELSFQLVGYAAYVVPLMMVVVGWNYFWCRKVDAAGTKATGGVLLFACISAFLSLVFGTLEVSGKSFRAGGYLGDWLARVLTAYFNRTGSLIVVLTLIFLSIIMSTQFSFGRFFAGAERGREERGRPHRLGVSGLARRASPRETAPRGDREAHEEGRACA